MINAIAFSFGLPPVGEASWHPKAAGQRGYAGPYNSALASPPPASPPASPAASTPANPGSLGALDMHVLNVSNGQACDVARQYRPGQLVRLQGEGFQPGSVLNIGITPGIDALMQPLLAAQADQAGRLDAPVTLPSALLTDSVYGIQVRGPDVDNGTRLLVDLIGVTTRPPCGMAP